METIKSFLYFLFHPSWWLMNYPYHKDVDKLFNYLLDNFEFEGVDLHGNEVYYAYLDGNEIWLNNVPYACMRINRAELRPSRKTILKGLRKFEKQFPDLKRVGSKYFLKKSLSVIPEKYRSVIE